MIVVDIGCARYGGRFDSLERLLEMFPATLRLDGFDANPVGAREAAWWLPDYVPGEPVAHSYRRVIEGVEITVTNAAAWVRDGQIGFYEAKLGSFVAEGERMPKVPCFDLATYIVSLGEEKIVLKLDCEGGEFVLLPHLMERCCDWLVDELWVEWHANPLAVEDIEARADIEARWNGEMHEWRW